MTTYVPPSGSYLANRLGLAYLDSLAEALGRNGLNALLNLSGAGALIAAPPAADLAREVDFATVANLVIALETVYGARQAGALAARAGRAMAPRLVEGFGVGRGTDGWAMRVSPLPGRLKTGLNGLAKTMNRHSDQRVTVVDAAERFDYRVDGCPVCHGRETRRPICALTTGLLQEMLVLFSRGGEYRVVQSECRAMGAAACVFQIAKEPLA